MPRPGVEVSVSEALPVRALPTDTSRWFFVDFAERGDHLAAFEVAGPSAAANLLGGVVAYSQARAAMDVFGGNAYFARVVGPNPVYASMNLTGTSGTTLVVTAKSVGDWANGATGGLQVSVANGPSGSSTRVLTITLNGVTVETTPEYTTRADFINWSLGSQYVTITAGGGTNSLPVVAAAASLTGGTDDHLNATDANWAAALARFTPDLGPGQESQLGRTTLQAHTDLAASALAHGRIAILDGQNTTTKATLKSEALARRNLTTTALVAAYFAPWLIYPGTAAGTVRTLPPSPFVARAIARTDPTFGPNQPAAGEWGRLEDVISIAATSPVLTETDYEELNTAGVNMIRMDVGLPTIYGWRTLADKTVYPLRWMLSNQRLEMLIRARAADVGHRFIFRRIDGQGITLAAWNSALTDMMMRLYLNGDLFADPDDIRPGTAFSVVTDSTVNTPTTLADGQLLADIAYRPAPFAELVKIRIVHVSPGVPIAA